MLEAIWGYVAQFIFIVAVAIGGVFFGKHLRERKIAKEELQRK